MPGVELEPVDNSSPLLRETIDRIGAQHHWPSVTASSSEWHTRMTNPALRHHLITVNGTVAGVAALEAQHAGDVEIVTFGLAPPFVGRGYGGAALTSTVQLAWGLHLGDGPAQRVWLHTSTLDHPNALPNYQRRGFHPTAHVGPSRRRTGWRRWR